MRFIKTCRLLNGHFTEYGGSDPPRQQKMEAPPLNCHSSETCLDPVLDFIPPCPQTDLLYSTANTLTHIRTCSVLIYLLVKQSLVI